MWLTKRTITAYESDRKNTRAAFKRKTRAKTRIEKSTIDYGK